MKALDMQYQHEYAALETASHVLAAFAPLLSDVSEAAETDTRWEDVELALRALALAMDRADLPPPAEFANDKIATIVRNGSSLAKMLMVAVEHVEHAAFRENVPWFVPAKRLLAKIERDSRRVLDAEVSR